MTEEQLTRCEWSGPKVGDILRMSLTTLNNWFADRKLGTFTSEIEAKVALVNHLIDAKTAEARAQTDESKQVIIIHAGDNTCVNVVSQSQMRGINANHTSDIYAVNETEDETAFEYLSSTAARESAAESTVKTRKSSSTSAVSVGIGFGKVDINNVQANIIGTMRDSDNDTDMHSSSIASAAPREHSTTGTKKAEAVSKTQASKRIGNVHVHSQRDAYVCSQNNDGQIFIFRNNGDVNVLKDLVSTAAHCEAVAESSVERRKRSERSVDGMDSSSTAVASETCTIQSGHSRKRTVTDMHSSSIASAASKDHSATGTKKRKTAADTMQRVTGSWKQLADSEKIKVWKELYKAESDDMTKRMRDCLKKK